MGGYCGLSFALVLLGCLTSSLAQCPEGWTSAGFHCYKAFSDPQTWNDAESHCQSFNVAHNKAHLTSVSGIPENVLLKNWLEVMETNVTESWLGLHPVNNAEEVLDDKWSDGSDADLTVWIEEGILDDEFMFMTKMCLVMNTAEGIWVPTDCNKPRPYVCKLSTCPSGWISHAGRCHHLFRARKIWSHAEKHCHSYANESDAHLVGIADAMETRFLMTLSEDKKEPFWIGMKGVNEDGVRSTWSEDEDFDLVGVDDPKSANYKNHTCVEMHVDGGIDWVDAPCSYKRPYICQLSHCKRGWTPIEGTCMFYTSEKKTNSVRNVGGSTNNGHKRVRRGFNSRRFGGNLKFGSTNTRTQTTRTSKYRKTISSQPRMNTAAAPPKALPIIGPGNLEPSQQLPSDTNPNMRCLGGWTTGVDSQSNREVCMRKWSPRTLNDAVNYCKSFTLTGDSGLKEVGRLAFEEVAEFRENPLRSFTCHMDKVLKTRLV